MYFSRSKILLECRWSKCIFVRRLSYYEEVSAIRYHEHGDPLKVLQSDILPLQTPGSNEVLIKMLASPVNPADINMIQGIYPVKTQLPAVGGSEGVGEIVAVGEDVKDRQLKVGMRVVPRLAGWGTWRKYGVIAEEGLLPVTDDIPVVSAATMGSNPCTAYRMLNDFAHLNPGDVVIQNGANSGVGQAVIQIAKELNIQTVNIVRNRDKFEALENLLKDLGGTHVITDEFVRSPDMKLLMKNLPAAKLALNCVGGKSTLELIKYLDKGGIMITYGGMSKQPVFAPTGPFIFKDISLKGFWMTQWFIDNQNNLNEKRKMWEFLSSMIRKGQFQAPVHRLVYMDDFGEAISKAMMPFTTEKQILVMDRHLL